MANNGTGKPARERKATPEVFKWRNNGGPVQLSSWKDIDEGVLHNVVTRVTNAGAAIIFGVTGDGGAFSVCVLDGESKIREYPHGKGECEELLAALAAAYDV